MSGVYLEEGRQEQSMPQAQDKLSKSWRRSRGMGTSARSSESLSNSCMKQARPSPDRVCLATMLIGFADSACWAAEAYVSECISSFSLCTRRPDNAHIASFRHHSTSTQ